MVKALRSWPDRGIPDAPCAWLITVARNRAIDLMRQDKTLEFKVDDLMHLEEEHLETSPDDDRLRLMFLCCHSSLSTDARIALTLRALGGLTTEEIAKAFLVPVRTMAQRLVRAKRKIRLARIDFHVPDDDNLEERLASVMVVLYLVFNEGYVARSGPRITRGDLCFEAIRLTRILSLLRPGDVEVKGLLALMLLHDSRRDARMDPAGNMIALEDQDRRKWNAEQIRMGDTVLREALATGPVGPYQIQAAISGVHARAENFASTDWREIVGLYERLHELSPGPVVRLNQTWALSMLEGPENALIAIVELEREPAMKAYQPLFAMKADLLSRAGRLPEAREAFEAAIVLSQNDVERRFLESKRNTLVLSG